MSQYHINCMSKKKNEESEGRTQGEKKYLNINGKQKT